MTPTDTALRQLYGPIDSELAVQRDRYAALSSRFDAQFPGHGKTRFFSASGRAEIGGNHTDHQRGRVLAASVNLDTIAAVAKNSAKVVRIQSEGFDPLAVDLSDLSSRKEEEGTTAAIVRGVAARFAALGRNIGGFDASVVSSVLMGSGLSSSAAFEVLICAIFDGLYGRGDMSPVLRAQISQYAENEYFGKPSGLMDQMASSVGGIVAIDFKEAEPAITAMNFDFAAQGYTLAVVNTGGSHDDLTADYAAIRAEMEQVAAAFGEKQLRDVDPAFFEDTLPSLRGTVSDRALLRAIHFFDENRRVLDLSHALDGDDLNAFFAHIIASGDSSWKLLQNVWSSPANQPLALALELTRRMLSGHGAWRVHGGGFAGTILAFVPTERFEAYAARMDAVFGRGACCPLSVRAVGAMEVAVAG